MQASETEKFLGRFIQVGDGIELSSGKIWPAQALVSERVGTSYFQSIVPVTTDFWIIPIHTYAIRAVHRNGTCVWRLGVDFVQRELF